MAQEKILLVEDEPLIALELESRIKRLGYKSCAKAVKTTEAPYAVQNYSPDLILMDLSMDGNISGIETAKQIQSITNTPIIYITAFTETDTFDLTKETIPYGYLTKPFQDRDLRVTIEMALHRSRLENELKKTKEELERNKSRNRILVNALPDLILRISKDGTILDYSAPTIGSEPIPRELFLKINNTEISHETIKTVTIPFVKKSIANNSIELFKYEIPMGLQFNSYEGRSTKLNDNEALVIIRDVTDQRQAEDSLKKSKEQLTLITANLPGIVFQFIAEPNGKMSVSYADGKIEEMLGLTSGKGTLFAKFVERIHPDYIKPFMQSLNYSVKNFFPWSFEGKFNKPSGETIWIRGISAPFKREPVMVFNGIILDITEHKRAEKTLRESEERFRDLIENSSDLICTHDLNGSLLSVNKAAVKITGYSEKELLKMNMEDIVVPEYQRIFKAYLTKIKALGKAKGLMTIQTKTGERRIWEYNNTLRTQGIDNPIVRGMVRDITEQKKIQESLRETELRFKQVSENAREWIWEVDKNGLYTYASPVVKEILGYEPQEIVGKKYFYDLFDQKERDNIKQLAFDIFTRKENFKDLVNINRHKDGRNIILSTCGVPILDRKGNLIGYRGVDVDITERERSGEKLKESETKYRLLFENNPHPMWVYDLETLRFLTVNNAAVNKYGYSKEEFLSMTLKDIRPPEDITRLLGNISKSEDQLQKSGAWRHKLKDGTIIFVDIHSHSIEYDNKKQARLVLALDITERKRAEEDLIIRNKLNLLKAKIWETVSKKSTGRADLINLMLEEAGNVLNISRATFLELDEQKKSFVTKYQWYRPEVGSTKKVLIPKKYVEQYHGQDYVQIPRQLNKIVRLFASPILKLYNIKSYLVVPFGNKSNPIGLFSFTDCIQERVWTDLEIEVLIDLSKILESFSIQREAEKMLITSEEKYRSVAQSANDAIITADSIGIMLGWNKGAEKIFGYKEAEITGKELNMIIPKSYVEQHVKGMKRIEQGGEHHIIGKTVELNGLHKSGKEFPLELSLAEWETSSGRFFTGIIRDITERKRAEEEITMLAHSLRSINECVSITDMEDKIIFVNKSFLKTYGYSENELVGKHISIVHPLNNPPELVKEILPATIRKGWTGELWNKRKDGNEFQIYLSTTIIKNKDGKSLGLIGIAQDITERKKVEKEIQDYRERLEDLVEERTIELRKSEEKFRILAESSEDTIMRFNRELRHLYVNPEVEKLTGIKTEKFIGKTYRDMDFPEDLVLLWETTLENVFENKEKNRIEFQLPSGIWLDWILIPEVEENGEVQTVITSGRDITKLKTYEDQMEKALQKEKELNELKSRFISTVSHEFRTPLASILSSTQLIQRYSKKWDEEKLNEHHERIKYSINNLTGLLDDVLAVSKSESQIKTKKQEKNDLEDGLNKIISELKPLLTEKHTIEFNYRIKDHFFSFEKKSFKLIFTNLLSNAIKYSPQGGKIKLLVKETNNDILFEVSDEGIGIDENELPNIFDPFYRTKKTEHIKGSGLGLAIVKQALQQYSGTIEVSSKTGKGTTFKIKIPLEEIKYE